MQKDEDYKIYVIVENQIKICGIQSLDLNVFLGLQAPD